jgi:NAD dependent epimerase/dehydratase family enzyme
MKVFVAGGSGAIGRRLVPELVARGHDVVATTTPDRVAALEAAGATPFVVDLLDGEAVVRAVEEAGPQIVVHQATALAVPISLRRFDASFARTNRLRTEGTDNLLAAAVASGAERFVAQSYTGWPNAREGELVKTEADPLDPHPPAAARETLAAMRTLEAAVAGCDGLAGVVLRYGTLYGPGTSLGEGGEQIETVRRRRLPLVGDGAGVWTFLHMDAVLYGDGGGKVRGAILRPVFGRERVTRLVLGFARTGEELGLRVRLAEVNGQPGAVAFAPDGSPYSVLALDVSGGAITAIRSVVNPDKLRHVSLRLSAMSA